MGLLVLQIKETVVWVVFFAIQAQNIGVVPDASRRGRRKGSNRIHPALLVQAQTISMRRRTDPSDLPDLTSLIVPGQVLTRANTGTYLDRIKRWAFLSSSGCGQHLGGDVVSEFLQTQIPLILLIFTSDACVTNDAVNGVEEDAFARGPYENVARMPIYCGHHQSALAQRLSILSIDGLVSGLVRLCNAATSTRFKEHFEKGLSQFARGVVRRQVISDGVFGSWRATNEKAARHCSCDLAEEHVNSLLEFFNGPWHLNQLEHWCVPGCCESERVFFEKLDRNQNNYSEVSISIS